MILDWLISMFAGVAGGFLSIIPTPTFVSLVSSISVIGTFIRPYYEWADYVAPVHEATILLGVVYIMRSAGLLVSVVKYVWSMLPFLGHGI